MTVINPQAPDTDKNGLEHNSSNQNSNTMVDSSDSDTDSSTGGGNVTEKTLNNNNRRVKLVTKLLVDMNSGLMDDLNFNRDVDQKHDNDMTNGDNNNNNRTKSIGDTDNGRADDTNDEYGSLIPMKEQQAVPKISKATRLRAERVRIYLDYYYNVMEGMVRSGEDENGHIRKNIHKNVEGIYNPLQVIRNRKLKKKYRGEVATTGFLFYKAPIIAVLQFSKIPNRKKYRWFVDVNEKYGDLTFRSQHWNELVDPHGNLWSGEQKIHRFRSEARKITKISASHITGHLPRHHHHHRKDSSKGSIPKDTDQSSDSLLNQAPKLIVTEDPSDPNFETRNSSNSNSLEIYSPDAMGNNLLKTASDSEIESIGGNYKEKDNTHLNKFEKILSKTKNKRWSRSKSPNRVNNQEGDDYNDVKKTMSNVSPQELVGDHKSGVNDNNHHRSSVSGPSGEGKCDTYQTPIDSTGPKKFSLLNDIPIRAVKTGSSKKESIETPERLTKAVNGSYKYDNEIHAIERKRGIVDKDIHSRLTVEGDEHHNVNSHNKNLTVSNNSGDIPKSASSIDSAPTSKESNSNSINEVPVDIQLQKYWQDTRYIFSTIAIMEHRRQTHDLIRQRAIHRRNLIKVDENTEKNMEDTERIIKEYDEGLDRVLKIGNNWTSKLLNDYSIRVETLISASDRILSDINTTLTLKLKLFQENTDKFGTIRTMQSQRMTKSIYKILEFLIVMVLWSIWLVVSILREIRSSILLVFRFIKWILW
ncbi:hypothetical protein C6P45_002423 [Maudiozyma exigua]|uniref:Maintenance of telomere capping protein 4 n=1 Tax=Maudiozyma exigua TaxID=34358 RepID=A0A9P7B3F9_MAUEX|nr:hypothetical protein C6P45_002423 [Kazachstania exigua]